MWKMQAMNEKIKKAQSVSALPGIAQIDSALSKMVLSLTHWTYAGYFKFKAPKAFLSKALFLQRSSYQ